MKIPERDAIEARLASKLARLGASQKRELLDLLGIPPDINRVPQSFWDRAGVDLRGVLSAEITELYMDAAERFDLATPGGADWDLVNERASTWARNYAWDFANKRVQNMRTAIGRAVSDFFENGWTRAELEKRIIAGGISPTRAEMIAITEVTRASVEGEREVARQLAADGIGMVPYWLTRNDELVCPVCGPKHDKEITDDTYPPAHPRCRCDVRFELPKVR